VNPQVWGAIAVGFAGILALAGSIFVGNRSKEASVRSAQIQADSGLASGYSLLTSDLRGELDRMHHEIKKLRGDVDEVKHRYRNALAYIRLLRAYITQNVSTGAPPPIPDDLTLDID
jgi:hypothetical protein